MSQTLTKCAGCGREVEFVATADGLNCPNCGAPFSDLSRRPRLPWVIFFLVLFAPALCSLLGVRLKSDGLAVGSVVFGSIVSGIICGTLLGRRLGRTTGSRFGLGIVFVCVFGAVSFVLGFFGCMVGGFNLNIH